MPPAQVGVQAQLEKTPLSSLMNPVTLRYHSVEANRLYEAHQTEHSFKFIDRHNAFISSIIPVTLLVFRPRYFFIIPAFCYLVILFLAAWAFAASSRQPRIENIYPRARILFACMWRVGLPVIYYGPLWMDAGWTWAISPPPPDLLHTSFFLLVSTRTFSLIWVLIGSICPFWLHLLLLPLQVLIYVATFLQPATDILCSCCEPSVVCIFDGIDLLVTWTQSVLRACVGTTLFYDPIVAPQLSSVCPAKMVSTFLLLGLGAVVPSMGMYCWEYDARHWFATRHPGLWPGLSLDIAAADPLHRNMFWLCVMRMLQVWLVLALLWQALSLVYAI